MRLDKQLAEEGADWIAEMASDAADGFVPSEFCDLLMETEERIRDESGDQAMDHAEMARRLMAAFAADPDLPIEDGAISEALILEILHLEDEFLALAGLPRAVRRP